MSVLDRDNWQEIFATIKKNKLRTALTMLGVAWGIFMLVIMLGAGNGLRHGIMDGFGGLATNSFFLWTQPTTKPYKGLKSGRTFIYDDNDVIALKKSPSMDIVCPQNQLGGFKQGNNVVRGLKTGSFSVMGQYPDFIKVIKKDIVKGRFINQKDIDDRRKVCVIGPRVQEILFKKGEDVMGQYIRINGVYFMVVGLTRPNQGGQDGEEDAQTIYLPFTTFQKAFNYVNKVGWFAIKAKDNVPAEVAEKEAIELLKERHKIAPDDKVAIGHWNMGVEFGKLNGLFNGIEILIWVVGIGTLLAGVIGISNIMLIVVKERTKEIGVKRALGATPANVVSQILLEALFITAIAGYSGLTMGIYCLEGLNRAIGHEQGAMFTNPTVDIGIAMKALSVIIVGGLIAGFIPARRAVAIHPVEALRTE
ncbi:MAG TPA: ABC transporter permease [Bacteroidia bacterium]|nr:ABC transporter permease [Bacteroidia bacterium]